MPTYEYRCIDCGQDIEVFQSFTDDPLTMCSTCGGTLRKVFSPVGVVLKGSGFYRTDSRSSVSRDGAKKKAEATTGSDAKDSSGSSGSKDSGGSSSSKSSSGDAKSA
jgi:putative FmdB family regulatory protein